MKKSLKRLTSTVWHFVDGVRVDGAHSQLAGDVSYLAGDVSWLDGNVSGLAGDVSGLAGNVTGIRGDVSGIRGDVSGISGDVSTCDISEEDRANGVRIEDLISMDVEVNSE